MALHSLVMLVDGSGSERRIPFVSKNKLQYRFVLTAL